MTYQPKPFFVFGFTNDGSAYQKEWKVTKLTKGQKLAHTWAYKGYSGSSELSFELFPEGAKTKLKITHTGLESFPDNSHFARHRFEWGWGLISDTLKAYVAK